MEIKNFYFEAASKKNKPLISKTEPDCTMSTNDLIDILAAGSIAKNAKSGLQNFDSKLIHSILEVTSVINCHLSQTNVEEVKKQINHIGTFKDFKSSITEILKIKIQEEIPKVVHETEKKETQTKKRLFNVESSDEEDSEQEEKLKQPQKQPAQTQKKNSGQFKQPVSGFQLAALPEKEEEEKDVFVKLEKKPRQFKSRHNYNKQEFQKSEKKEDGEPVVGEGEEKNRNGYKGKKYDPNYKGKVNKLTTSEAPKHDEIEVEKNN